MEEIHSNPSRIDDSFIVSHVLHANVVDLSKKRKLLDKQLSLPIRKLKFRDGDPRGEHSSLFVGEPEGEIGLQTHMMKVVDNVLRDDDKSLQPESEMDSNSFIEESDCAMSQYTEAKYEPDFSKAFEHDEPTNSNQDFIELVHTCDKPSTSTASCSSNSSKSTLYTLDNGSFKNLHNEEEESGFTEEVHHELGYLADCIYSDNVHEELEGSLHIESQDMRPNPSEMPSDLFVLSSGRWKINHGAQAGIRKPTIDQEFEQYFSSLML